jgi:GH15 family glucan-1,4-alpha-glucosidase
VLYDVMGGVGTRERSVAGLPGYGGSLPVRDGNEAGEQFQLDPYGWLLDAAWVMVRDGGELHPESWRAMRGHADLLAEVWPEPDAGIWELRGPARHYVHGKLMAWAGLDRAIRLADRNRTSPSRRARWERARNDLGEQIRAQGFDHELGSYVRSYGERAVDAALLELPAIGLDPPMSPRVVGTIRRIRSELSAGGPLLYRMLDERGSPPAEGAFLACSFWLARALALSGSVDEAHEVFGAACAAGSPLGLFAEEIDPATGAHLGNFPLALTHSALVEAATSLSA